MVPLHEFSNTRHIGTLQGPVVAEGSRNAAQRLQPCQGTRILLEGQRRNLQKQHLVEGDGANDMPSASGSSPAHRMWHVLDLCLSTSAEKTVQCSAEASSTGHSSSGAFCSWSFVHELGCVNELGQPAHRALVLGCARTEQNQKMAARRSVPDLVSERHRHMSTPTKDPRASLVYAIHFSGNLRKHSGVRLPRWHAQV